MVENVTFGLEVRGVEQAKARDIAMRWIERVGLHGFDARYPHELSGDMQQHAMVAPAAGLKPMFGTNPLAFGAPLPPPRPPLVIDQSSSATAFVNIARAAAEGRPIPAGWAVDAGGQPTCDPAEAVRGALLPFGGAKGANMALLVEIMAAGLGGAAWSLDAGHFREGSRGPGVGLTVIAIAAGAADPGFAERLAAHVDRIAARGVHIPGMRARPSPADTDLVSIDRHVLAAIEAAAG